LNINLTEYSESEFISMKDAPSVIASCFKHPFSGPNTPEDENPKRNIVLVGHAVGGDVTFLKDLGYDVTNLSNLIDVVDTADMWKYLKKETNPAKLGVILHDLGMVGWNLHNAGNDAVYTLQVMVGLAIKHIVQKGKPQFLGLHVA
jgi:DNA polymerase III alpha subunit (gram-positive type)